MAFATSNSLSWDLQTLGVFNADMSTLVMDHEAASFFSPLHHSTTDFSTGYLEDALVEFSERSKRRKLLLFNDEYETNGSKDFEMSYWNNSISNWGLHQSEDYSNCMSQITSLNGVSDELMSTMSGISNEEANMISEIKTPEEATSSFEALDSSSSSYKDSVKTKSLFDQGDTPFSKIPSFAVGEEKRKKRVNITKVVHPFALVKPGGTEGDVTLNDINERILMRPTRPVKHPVGDFACRPCVSADGRGLSGKTVVALTRIHTQGRGTITIIRTKG